MRIRANDYEEKAVMKILREWTDLSQQEFGEEIGLSKMTIQGYERGERRYTFETLMKIVRKHGFTLTIEKRSRK
jgi:transcriptional regulator with XRE-family HTH domain